MQHESHNPVAAAPLNERERLRVVIGGRAFVLSSLRDRAYTLAVATEADHLLEHLKIRYPNISDSARRTLAVVNVLDQKNEAGDALEVLKRRLSRVEEQLADSLRRLHSLQTDEVPAAKKGRRTKRDPLLEDQQTLFELMKEDEA